MLTLFTCIISRSPVIALMILVATGFLTVFIGKIPISYYIRSMKWPLSFLCLSIIAIAFGASSLQTSLQLLCTAMASISCLYFLSLSTPMTDILMVLRKMHCPKMIIELMLLIYRFTFLLLNISSAISISQRSRLGNRNLKISCQSTGILISTLFIRALKKSSLLYDAMESRCYQGDIRILEENYPPKAAELIFIFIFEAIIIGLTIYIKL